MSPDLSSPLPESVLADEGDKEVVFPHPQPLPYQRPAGDQSGRRRRICGIPKLGFRILLMVLIILAIGLGLGLGIGLGTKHPSDRASSPMSSNSTSTVATPVPTNTGGPFSVGGAINPAYYGTYQRHRRLWSSVC